MTRNERVGGLLTAVATLALVAGAPAQAQTQAPAQAADPSQAGTAPADDAAAQTQQERGTGASPNGDIVVTGDRNNQFGTDVVQSGSFRNAKVLDVPLTVSVIPSAVLRSQQAIELLDAVRNTAGVATTGTGTVAYQNLTIRGIAVDTRSNFRMDGALNMLSGTALPLEDKDRVEVPKGASALYYGFSSPSGIINMTMKRPTPELFFFENTFGDTNGSLGEHVDIGNTMGIFGYRLNAVAAHLDSGIQYAEGQRYAVSGAFDLKPTDQLTITADVEYFEKAIVEPALFLLTIPTTATAVRIPDVRRLDPKVNIGGADWDFNRSAEFNYLGKAVYKFSRDWNLSGYYGRSYLDRKRNNPQFTPTNLTTSLDPASPSYGAGTVRFSAQQATFENVNYALELAGTTRLGSIRNEVLIGASRVIRTLASSPNVRTSFAQNFARPRRILNPNLAYTALPATSQIDDKGLYVFDRLSFNDVVQLLGGVRKSWYRNDGSINLSTKTPYKAEPTSYSGGVVVKPVEWASAYATYIEGLEETPSAPSIAENVSEVFPPTNSKQYEAGLKFEPKPNLLIQMAYSKIDRGAAYTANKPGTTTLFYYTDGREVYEGGEFSLTGYVLPDLALNLAATKLSAHYRDNPGIAGKRVDGTPDYTWSVSGEYRPSWIDKGLKLTAGVYRVGSQALNANNQAFTDGYTTFDLGGSYTFVTNGHELTARINGQNITNKRYWASVGGGSLAEAVPGLVKFSLSFGF